MSFSTDEINTGVPELLDRISTLESEVARLAADRDEERKHTDFYIRETHKIQNQRNEARALLRELAVAVKARDVADIARSLRPGDERIEAERFAAGDALLNLLRRAEAETGEENADG